MFSKSIIRRVDRNLGRRLREARRELGVSGRVVAARLPNKLAVSHTTLASYENGLTTPPIDVLAALAELYKRPLNWFLEDRETLSAFRFRNLKARVPLHDQRQFEAMAGKWMEAYFRLFKHLRAPERHTIPALSDKESDPRVLAECIRKRVLNLDDAQPIQSTVHVLESHSAWALELRASFAVDGAAGRIGKEFVVVLNPEVSNERVRMNVAHELAHVLYSGQKDELGWTDAMIEKRAYVFASSLLLPESQLREAFDGKSFLRLIQFKEKFGISLAAMIFMAEQSKIINTTTARWLWKEMTKRGWRNNEPGYVWRDRAITFETMLESAIHTNGLTWADAERITGVRESDLQSRLANAIRTTPAGNGTDENVRDTVKFVRPGGTESRGEQKK